MTTQPGNTPNVSLGNLNIAHSLGIAKDSFSYDFLNTVSKILGSLNQQYNPSGTKVNPYTHKTSAYSNTDYGSQADFRVQETIDKVAVNHIKGIFEEKLNTTLTNEQNLAIYRGLQSSGKLPSNTSKDLSDSMDDYFKANLAGVLEKASKKDIEETYGKDSNITKLILKGKNLDTAAKRFNFLSSFCDENLDEIFKLDQESKLAKNFRFSSDGSVSLKKAELLDINSDIKPFVEERKAHLDMYMANLQKLATNFTTDELKNAYSLGSQSNLSGPKSTNSDSFSRSSYPSNTLNPGSGNAYANRLRSEANQWVNNVYQPQNRNLRMNYSVYSDPLRNSIFSSDNLFNNNSYGLNNYPYGLSGDYNAGWNPAG